MATTLHPLGYLGHWCPKRSTVQQMAANEASRLLGYLQPPIPREIRSFHPFFSFL